MNTPDPKRPSSARDAKAKGHVAKLWRWGAGAGVVATLAGTALLNARRSEASERENPPIGKFVDVDGTRLHYLVQGEGPLILLIHGNGTMIQDWIACGVMDQLARTHRVIAFDRPGFGYSDRPRSRIWTPAAQAQLIAKALRELGEETATVVGHSFGTLVALQMAIDHPQQVSSIALLGGYYYPSVRGDVVFAAPPAVPLLGDVMRYTISPLIGGAMKPRIDAKLFNPAPVAESWSERFPFQLALRPSQIRAEAAEAAMMVPAAAKFAGRVDELTLPVAIVAGRGDEVVDTAAQAERLAQALPNSRLLIVEGAGHMVHHTAPDDVVRAIVAIASTDANPSGSAGETQEQQA